MNYFLAYMNYKKSAVMLGFNPCNYLTFYKLLKAWDKDDQEEAFRFWNAAC